MSDHGGEYLQADKEHGRSAADEVLIERARDLDELVNGHPENVEAVLPELESMLLSSTDPLVVLEVIIALGHVDDRRAGEFLLDHVDVADGDPEIRLALTRALPHAQICTGTPSGRVVDALVALSADVDDRVRDWACFGLGQIEAASPEALDALAARLTDPYTDARCEALWSLAQASDPRALHHLRERFASNAEVNELELKAAAELADPALYPLLLQLDAEWEGDDDDFTPLLAFALARCRPEAQASAAMVEETLLSQVNALFAGTNFTASFVARYPRTRIVVVRSDDPSSTVYDWPIWDDREPLTYPFEQEAGSVLLTVQKYDTGGVDSG